MTKVRPMLRSPCFAYDFQPVPAPPATRELGDIRFRSLLSSEEWQELPIPVRKRFSKRLAGLDTAVYRGEVVHTRMNAVGWCLAQLGRLIGAPLPLSRDAHVPAVVTVTEDPATGGQFWSRHYNRHSGFPQVIHSSKRFGGPTGLEEYVGGGVGMALNIHVREGALVFTSSYYFLAIGKHRLRLPKWATPGALTVTHRAIDDELFEFSLRVVHPLFGELVHQFAVFEETAQ
jgi:Domain of unknown function (DUF4166)